MTLREMGERLAGLARGSVRFDDRLAPLTTYRLGGPATVLFEPASSEDLLQLSRAVEDSGLSPTQVPLLVVGRGSNIVISDRGFDGLVLRLGAALSWIRGEDDGHPNRVTAGAATPLPLLANWAARRSLTGLEFTVGIPGSVGGGVRMNAGAHGGEVAETLLSVETYSFGDGGFATRPVSSLGLGYRRSALRPSDVVLSASFQLVPDAEIDIKNRVEAYRTHRAQTQPGALQNAGSTFKNPPGDSAGRLVEAAGLKGHSVGGARVSELHANFFIASQGAKAQDVFDLIADVRRRVYELYGVDLEPEVTFVGPFDTAGVRGIG